MPRLPINYENACIYEIVCKDVNITQRYIGSSTNLIKRRSQHKSDCNNEKSKQYNQYVYQFIRANGGFENWNIVLIEKLIDCKDKEHLHKQERYYIESLKAELNKQIPLRTSKERYVENIEKYKEYQKEYRENNKDEINEKQKEYNQDNKEKIVEQRKNYYQDNKEKIAVKNKEYREKNKIILTTLK